jgi:TRAP transporter TAXI family solute receptor
MDAILWIGNPVDAGLVDAATVKPLQIIELSEEVRQKIIQANPGYVPYTIPVNNYRGVTEPIQTVSIPTVLITNKHVPEEAMYKMTKALAENLDYLGDTDANYKALKPESLYYDFGVAYHEGALRYYREVGLAD